MAGEAARRSRLPSPNPAADRGSAPAGDLEDFFENGAVGLHLVGGDGTILRANRAELEMLGYAPDAYIGRNIREFHADEPVIADILVRLGRGEQLDNCPARLRAADGSLRHVLITSSALFKDGRFVNTRCFTIDVTEQKRADDALRQSHEMLEAVVETNPECVIVAAKDGRILRINAAGQRLIGQDRLDPALCVFNLVAPEDRAGWRAQHDRVCRGERLHWQFDFIDTSGLRRRMETHGAPLPLPNGGVAHLAVTRDITERSQQEQRLRDSERRLRELLEALPAAIYTTDAEGHITFYNEAAVELAGRRPEIGAQWCVTWKLYLPDGTPLPLDQCPMAVALKEQRPIRGAEAIAERPDGTRVPFIPYPTPLRDASGRVIGAVNMLVDITDRKAAETQLQESEERLGRLLHLAPLGIAEISDQGRIVYANDAAEQLLRLEREPDGQAYARPVWRIATPEGQRIPRRDQPVVRVLRGETVSGCEVALSHADGNRVVISVNAMPLRRADGAVGAVLAAFTNVTARHQAELALRDSEERFRTLADNLPQLAWMADAGGSTTWFNQRWYAYSGGLPPRTMQQEGWLSLVESGMRVEVAERWRCSIATGAAFDMVLPLKGENGVCRPFLTRAAPVQDEAGRVVRWFGTHTDISDQQRIEEALRASEEGLQRLAETLELRVQREVAAREEVQMELFQAQKLEAIGQLTGGTAHDFNNLLAAILGNLELLAREALTPKGSHLVAAAIRAAEKGGMLTNQLLAYARRQTLTWQSVNVRSLVQGLEEMVRRTLGGLVEVRVEMPGNLWPVATDSTQLELAILNLAINARDAMPEGGTLRISAKNNPLRRGEVTDLAAGDYVRVQIEDTGIGMPAETLAKATDPFFTTKEIGRGSGLGLSQVYGLVKQCGGALRIESEVGQGTCVRIWLPRTAAGPKTAAAASAVDSNPPRPGKVLVVDDDGAVRAVTADLLRDAGYRVEEAADAQAAIVILDTDDAIELALVDYAMPLVSGQQFVQEARRRRPNLAVVYVTGFAAADALGSDTCSVLKKPYRRAELLNRVEEAWPAARPVSYTDANVVAMRAARRRPPRGK